MRTRDPWIFVVLLVVPLLACKNKRGDYTRELTGKLGKECVAVEEGSDSEPGIVVSCDTEKALKLAESQVRQECAKIKSLGFKKLRMYQTEVMPNVSLKGTVEDGCTVR